MVTFLTLEMHCDPTARNADYFTALHLVIQPGCLDIVQFFISDQNCDPNILARGRGTLLHKAVAFGHLHIVKYLTDEQGCSPSVWMNTTALHFTVLL